MCPADHTPLARLAVLAAATIALAGCPAPGPRMDPEISPSPQALVEAAVEWNRPQICARGQEVYLAWSDLRDDKEQAETYFVRSEDGGRTWTGETRMSTVLEDPAASRNRDTILACDPAGPLHLVWWSKIARTTGNRPFGEKTIYYRRSLDGGRSWDTPVPLNRGGKAFIPYLALDGRGSVYVAWNDERNGGFSALYLNRSTNAGATWQDEDFRLDGATKGSSDAIRVNMAAAPDGSVHAVWEDHPEGDPVPFYRRSEDHGESWSGVNYALSDLDAMSVLAPQIQVSPDGRSVVAAWLGSPGRDPNYGVYAMHSEDGGRSWPGDPVELTAALELSDKAGDFLLAGDGSGRFYAVWDDSRHGRPDIYLAQSTDGGASWSDPVRLDTGTEMGSVSAEVPWVASSPDGRVFVTWMDRRLGGRPGVFARGSTDFGATWGEVFHVGGGTDDASGAGFPKAVLLDDPKAAVVVWQQGAASPEQLRSRRVDWP